MEGSGTAVLASALGEVDFSGMTTEFVAVFPVVIPVALTWLSIRKAVSFMFSTLRGA